MHLLGNDLVLSFPHMRFMHLLWSDPSFVISTQLDLNRCFFNDSSLVISTQLGLNSYIECSLICHFYTTWFEQLY